MHVGTVQVERMVKEVILVVDDDICHPDVVGYEKGCDGGGVDLLTSSCELEIGFVDVVGMGDVVDEEPAEG